MYFSYFLFIRCEKQITQKDGMVLIQGEGDIMDYWLDVSPVTVGDFNKFVRATH